MCMCLCLNRETYKAFRCVPLWVMFGVVMLITLCENLLYLVDPLFMMPSVVMTLIFLPGLCSCRSLKIRNCIWVSYLVIGLIQLMVCLVAFIIILVFPDDEECTQLQKPNGDVMYYCTEKESKTSGGTIVLLLSLTIYYVFKNVFLVCFLHAFARKIIWDEKQKVKSLRREEYKLKRKQDLEM